MIFCTINKSAIKLANLVFLYPLSAGALSQPVDINNLTEERLQYFSFRHPGYELKEYTNLGRSGKYVYSDPKGGGRFLRVSWGEGKPLSSSEERALAAAAGLNKFEVIPFYINRSKYEAYKIGDGKNRELLITSVGCGGVDVWVKVATFISGSRADLFALHKKMIGSINCQPDAPAHDQSAGRR